MLAIRRTREFLLGLTTTARISGPVRLVAKARLVDVEIALKSMENRE